MDDEDDREFLPPANTNTFGIPNEPDLRLEYELYRPSMRTRRLHSERNREVYTEAFIENERLGTLADLCVRALAKMGTGHIPPPIKEDPLKLRVYYDALDVDMPLKNCYFVDDMRFWRRVVLAKSSDKSLSMKKIDEFDWKGKGVSLKYVELVEACPAAYWPEKQMAELGYMVREYVKKMHIRHLQSLTEHAFSQYVGSDSELDVTSDESLVSEISSDERDTNDGEEEEGGEEEDESELVPSAPPAKNKSVMRIGSKAIVEFDDHQSLSISNKDSEDDLHWKRRESRMARNAARQQLRDLFKEKQEEHEKRKLRRELLRNKPLPEPTKKKKKKKAKPIQSVFDMVVEPEPDDGEDKIADGRNKLKMLDRIKRYDYPPKHCHHIDLSFVRYFDQLASLHIEFLGPKMEIDYHKRHMNFSYDDMLHLAKGLRTLENLKIFRLRNSRMDQIKLLILVRVLKQLDSLEVVDFGYDQLEDNCAIALKMLLDRRTMLKALELEYNELGRNALEAIGQALKHHHDQEPEGTPLEYLGLAHNPVGDFGLQLLVMDIVGTNHVQELNINGVMADGGKVASLIGFLLRNHTPLLRLDIAAVRMNPTVGRDLICGLETNHKVIHLDCRACDLDSEEEFEADVIVRRNKYEVEHPYLGDETQTEESLLEYVNGLKHPILAKIEANKAQREECIRQRVPEVSRAESIVEEEVVEELEDFQEFDIWKTFGVNNSTGTKIESLRQSLASSSHQSAKSFHYTPNEFTLEEFKEHLHVPGPANRYYYFQKHKEGGS